MAYPRTPPFVNQSLSQLVQIFSMSPETSRANSSHIPDSTSLDLFWFRMSGGEDTHSSNGLSVTSCLSIIGARQAGESSALRNLASEDAYSTVHVLPCALDSRFARLEDGEIAIGIFHAHAPWR